MRVRGRAALSDAARLTAPQAQGAPSLDRALKGERQVIWYDEGVVPATTPIYDGRVLGPGARGDGPALLELPDTSVVIRGGQSFGVDSSGSIVIDL
jgi:N-methylhydantoinase A